VSAPEIRAMREPVIERIRERMHDDAGVFFLTADFGSPALDRLRAEFPDRFLNVGIAEQNMVNIATGLALEGYKVFAYAIAVFATLRCYEQLRVNLGVLAQLRPMSVHMIGVGAGVSYDVSGPTHHGMEELAAVRAMPRFAVACPSDWVLARKWVDHAVDAGGTGYIRLDGKPVARLYDDAALAAADYRIGFHAFSVSAPLTVVATGFMTQKALRLRERLAARGVAIGVVDVFNLRDPDGVRFREALHGVATVVTLEEGFPHRGGLDTLVRSLLDGAPTRIRPRGFAERYTFEIGPREFLHEANGLDEASLEAFLLETLAERA